MRFETFTLGHAMVPKIFWVR